MGMCPEGDQFVCRSAVPLGFGMEEPVGNAGIAHAADVGSDVNDSSTIPATESEVGPLGIALEMLGLSQATAAALEFGQKYLVCSVRGSPCDMSRNCMRSCNPQRN